MKKRMLAAICAVLLCQFCFTACGEADEGNTEDTTANESVTATAATDEEDKETTSDEQEIETETKTETTSNEEVPAETTEAEPEEETEDKENKGNTENEDSSEEKSEEATDNNSDQVAVDAPHYSAVIDSSKWYTEDKPDDMIVTLMGMSYKWSAQKKIEKPSVINFGPTLDDFKIEDLDQEKLNGETDINKVFLLIAENKLNTSYIEIQLSDIEEHSGVKMSHLRCFIDYAATGTDRTNMYEDQYYFYAGGAMNELVIDYTDDDEGHAAYDEFLASVLDDLTIEE